MKWILINVGCLECLGGKADPVIDSVWDDEAAAHEELARLLRDKGSDIDYFLVSSAGDSLVTQPSDP